MEIGLEDGDTGFVFLFVVASKFFVELFFASVVFVELDLEDGTVAGDDEEVVVERAGYFLDSAPVSDHTALFGGWNCDQNGSCVQVD